MMGGRLHDLRIVGLRASRAHYRAYVIYGGGDGDDRLNFQDGSLTSNDSIDSGSASDTCITDTVEVSMVNCERY
jgi:hypothetical protein